MKVLNADPGACFRCGATATEVLRFESKHNGSELYLCKDCFERARELFNAYFLQRKNVEDVLKEFIELHK